MSAEAWAYVHGSSGLESTAEANADAFDAWRIVPRVLRDVTDRDLGVSLFGRSLPHSPARRAGRRARARGRRRRPGDRPRGGRPRHPGRALEPGVDADGARRGRGRRRAALVPALLELVRRAGGELRRPRREDRRRRRSSSPSTPRCSAGVRATSTGRSCRSSAAWASRSTPRIRSSSASSPSASPARAARHRSPGREGAGDAGRRPHARRHDPPVPRALRREPALGRAARGRRDVPRRVLAVRPAVVRSRVPAGAHEAADPAQGDPASG